MHRIFLNKVAHNENYLKNFCNDWSNTFQDACRQWYSYNNEKFLE